MSSSESQRYFELSLSSLDFIAQKRRGVSKEDGLRNQVWFPVIIHPFMCTTLLLKYDHRKLLIYTPRTPLVIVTLTTGLSSPAHNVCVMHWDMALPRHYRFLSNVLQLMTRAVILIKKVIAAGKGHTNKTRPLGFSLSYLLKHYSLLIICQSLTQKSLEGPFIPRMISIMIIYNNSISYKNHISVQTNGR